MIQRQISRACPVTRTARVMQLEGMFDLPPAARSERSWTVELPLQARPWQIGLIVGPSGAGKSTVARELFGPAVVSGYDWPARGAVIDGFPADLGLKEITGYLSAVGFSSPPAWLRPFETLSTGEQFRVTLARALAERSPLIVVDEFTSVVDRTVARIGSSAVAKAIRSQPDRKLVAVSCHSDIIDWLQPDWILLPAEERFQWRSLQRRPEVTVRIQRSAAAAWPLFRAHHYLAAELHRSATCFVAQVEGQPAAFCAVIHYPHPRRSFWKIHRSVVLPDYQGIGLGNRLIEFIASLFVCTGKPVRDVTGHPALIAHRLRHPELWRCCRRGKLMRQRQSRSTRTGQTLGRTTAVDRITWSFEYVGPGNPLQSARLGVLKSPPTNDG